MDPIETHSRRVRRFQNGEWNLEERTFPLEVPVAVYVNAGLLSTLSATPDRLPELALGFLFAEGLISTMEDVKDVSAMADPRRGQVWVELTRPPKALGNGRITSGCGRGTTFLCPSDLDAFTPLTSDRAFSPGEIRKGFRSMRERACAYKDSGGIHAAACMGSHDLLAVAEDIGRHNAVDKVIGAMLREGLETRDTGLITTGRISSEMALKAVVAGAPLVASMTGATHMALEVCRKLGVTLVIYVRGERMEICTHPERIENGAGQDQEVQVS